MKRIPMSNLRAMSKRWILGMQEPHVIMSHGTPVGVLLTWTQYETAMHLKTVAPVEGPAVIPGSLAGDAV